MNTVAYFPFFCAKQPCRQGFGATSCYEAAPGTFSLEPALAPVPVLFVEYIMIFVDKFNIQHVKMHSICAGIL